MCSDKQRTGGGKDYVNYIMKKGDVISKGTYEMYEFLKKHVFSNDVIFGKIQ